MDCGNKANCGAGAGCVFPSNVSFTLRRCFYKDAPLHQSQAKPNKGSSSSSSSSLKGGFDECFSDFAALCCLCRVLSDDYANLFRGSSADAKVCPSLPPASRVKDVA